MHRHHHRSRGQSSSSRRRAARGDSSSSSTLDPDDDDDDRRSASRTPRWSRARSSRRSTCAPCPRPLARARRESGYASLFADTQRRTTRAAACGLDTTELDRAELAEHKARRRAAVNQPPRTRDAVSGARDRRDRHLADRHLALFPSIVVMFITAMPTVVSAGARDLHLADREGPLVVLEARAPLGWAARHRLGRRERGAAATRRRRRRRERRDRGVRRRCRRARRTRVPPRAQRRGGGLRRSRVSLVVVVVRARRPSRRAARNTPAQPPPHARHTAAAAAKARKHDRRRRRRVSRA